MSRFLVVNPNTSDEMTRAIEKTIMSSITSGNEADVIRAETGPKSLETFYEYGLATIGVITTLKKIDIRQYDGMLLACFGDPGLYALKEIIPVPVVGIAEASISMSLLLGSSFAILVALEKAVPMMKNMVQQYGLTDRMAGVFPLGIPVLDLEEDESKTIEVLIKVGQKAKNQGAEVLLLGCAGMTGFSDKIEKELGVAVIDPVKTGFKMLECLVESGLKVSRTGLYMPLDNKEIIGMDFIKRGGKL